MNSDPCRTGGLGRPRLSWADRPRFGRPLLLVDGKPLGAFRAFAAGYRLVEAANEEHPLLREGTAHHDRSNSMVAARGTGPASRSVVVQRSGAINVISHWSYRRLS
jgi:hypothetical protein